MACWLGHRQGYEAKIAYVQYVGFAHGGLVQKKAALPASESSQCRGENAEGITASAAFL